MRFEDLGVLGSKSWSKQTLIFSSKNRVCFLWIFIPALLRPPIAIPICAFISSVSFSRFGLLQIKTYEEKITLIECEAQPQTTCNILPVILWFYYLPKISLWLRLWQYHLSNKQTAKSSDLRSYFDYLPQVHLGVKL